MTKKLLTVAFGIFSSIAFAQASDPFVYTGALNANGWTTHSGTVPGQLVTVSGSLNYAGLTSAGNKTQIIAGNGEDINLASAAPLTGVAYYSAIINFPDTVGLSPNTDNGSYFLMFGSTAGATVTDFNARLYDRLGTTPNTINLAVLNGSGGTSTPTYTGIDYPINTPLFVVVKFDFASNTASLFVNPAIGGSESTPTVTNATGTTLPATQFASVVIRQAGTATKGTGNVQIDEIRVGSTWQYVTASVLGTTQIEIAGLKIYPNPVSNGILFISSENNKNREITITDVLGKQILQKFTTQESIDISELKTGIYFVKIKEDGKTASKKLMVR